MTQVEAHTAAAPCNGYQMGRDSDLCVHCGRMWSDHHYAAPQEYAPTSKRGSEVDASDSYAPAVAAPKA